MTNLVNPPKNFTLPLSRGQDLVIDFQNQDTNGASLDYPDGTTLTLIIDGAVPVSQAATISGGHAMVFVPYTTTDQILARVTWRCVIDLPGSPDVHIVPCNGTTSRADGN